MPQLEPQEEAPQEPHNNAPQDELGVHDDFVPPHQPNLRRSSKKFRPPRHLDQWWILDESEANLVSSMVDEPSNVQEALEGIDKNKWMAAMQEEMDSMHKNKV